MVLNDTFNNISAISWRSVLPDYPEKTVDLSQVTDKPHNVVLSTPHHERGLNSQP